MVQNPNVGILVHKKYTVSKNYYSGQPGFIGKAIKIKEGDSWQDGTGQKFPNLPSQHT